MHKSWLITAAAMLAALPGVGGGAARGQDRSPPEWRGSPTSTYQRWDFSAGPQGSLPDVLPWDNAYGWPGLFPIENTTWQAHSPAGVPPASDIWQVGLYSRLGVRTPNLNIPVPNGPTQGCTQVVASIVYFGSQPEVTIEPIAGMGNFSVRSDATIDIDLGNGWNFVRYDYTLFSASSPERENVFVTCTGPQQTWLDYMVVDTRVLPAPGAGVALLVLGGMAGPRRRRRPCAG